LSKKSVRKKREEKLKKYYKKIKIKQIMINKPNVK
jgi:hypothetical protein